MKHFLHKLMLLAVCLMASIYANAYDTEVDGIYYNFRYIHSETDKLLEVTSGDKQYTGDIVIPSTISLGGEDYTVVSIGQKAFYDCKGLTSVTIPNSVTAIGNYAFAFCSNLTSVTIPNSVTNIGDYAFDGCRGLTSLVIPDSVTSIGTCAFWMCSSLATITLPKNLTQIATQLFLDCNALKEITIPASVSEIHSSAFHNCGSLKKIICEGEVPATLSSGAFDNSTLLTCVLTVPVDAIERYLESEWKEFMMIIDSEGNYIDVAHSSLLSRDGIYYKVLSREDKTLEVTEGLEKYSGDIVIPATISLGGEDYTVISVGNNAFKFGNITGIALPNTIENIGESAFYWCRRLTSIVIPDSVRSIGFDAFDNCDGLTSIVIPNSVRSIGSDAFYSCDGLTSIVIPNSVRSIGSSAFYSCM